VGITGVTATTKMAGVTIMVTTIIMAIITDHTVINHIIANGHLHTGITLLLIHPRRVYRKLPRR